MFPEGKHLQETHIPHCQKLVIYFPAGSALLNFFHLEELVWCHYTDTILNSSSKWGTQVSNPVIVRYESLTFCVSCML
jgi:hypothetical protein